MRKASAAKYMGMVADEPRLYVVANRTDAVFYLDGRDRRFHFVDRLKNSQGHLTETQLVSDKPGKGRSSSGDGVVHHSLDRRFGHHEQVAKDFARRIAGQLEAALRRREYRELVLVAEPHFLGLLRGELDERTRGAVVYEIKHEYAQGSDVEVRALIMNAIASSD